MVSFLDTSAVNFSFKLPGFWISIFNFNLDLPWLFSVSFFFFFHVLIPPFTTNSILLSYHYSCPIYHRVNSCILSSSLYTMLQPYIPLKEHLNTLNTFTWTTFTWNTCNFFKLSKLIPCRYTICLPDTESSYIFSMHLISSICHSLNPFFFFYHDPCPSIYHRLNPFLLPLSLFHTPT